MNFKTSKPVSFGSVVKLNRYEKWLQSSVKDILHDNKSFAKVDMKAWVEDWNGAHVKIRSNANELKGSDKKILDDFNECIKNGDDIEEWLEGNSLTIEMKVILAAASPDHKKENKDMKKDDERKDPLADTPDFLPIKGKHRFNQIILPDNVKNEIFDALKIIECRDLIYNKWGFGEIDSIPRSVLNFYGPPGTGKTMSAHAIAQKLNKKLLALNYAEIESKYVGEAAKNLQKAFNVAKDTDSILFFDEADSFLGKRVENVSHGSDQALNSLRSQMLILMEEFEGIIIFATNLVTNFDHAFKSRILKHIRFELPNEEARAAIIKKMLPSRLPVNAPISDEQILEVSKLIEGFSGREIKGTILDLLLSKATLENPEKIVFSIEDIKDVFAKKKKALDELKAEEERRLKEKIEKKIKEKAEEARAMRAQEEADEKNDTEENNEKSDNLSGSEEVS